ncbi:MAG: DUF5131 family protein [Coriobacteriales bacterium]
MHDIWNPWHGCTRVSEGCAHCYMFTADAARGLDGGVVRRSRGGFDYPLRRTRDGAYKVRSGELIRVCMNSDFFLEEADPWRAEAWSVIYRRPDVKFFLLTKRPERVAECLPPDWGEGWENVMLNVTCENQRRADERMPILLDVPARHKGVMCAPLIGAVDLGRYLDAPSRGARVEQVICGGENYDDPRPCDFAWAQALSEQCRARDVTFAFIETGTNFVVDGRRYRIPRKAVQAQQAFKAGVEHRGRPVEWRLTDPLGMELPADELYEPRYRARCRTCGSHLICNGCCNCGLCGEPPEELLPASW